VCWFWTLLVSAMAAAEPLSVHVQTVRTAIAEQSTDAAQDALQQAITAAPRVEVVTDAQAVGELLYYQGLVPMLVGAEGQPGLNDWRDALVVFPELKWDPSLSSNREQQAVFEALRGEVTQRPVVPTGVPSERGAAQMFVDGVLHVPGQAVRAGMHLAQVKCPDGEVAGKWTRFETPVSWTKLCSAPIDLTVAVAAPAEDEDFGFGMDEDPRQGPDPLPASLVIVAPPPSFAQRWRRPLLLGAGGSMVIAGGLYVGALLSRAKYDKLDARNIETQTDLDALRARTNAQAGLSVTFGVVGVGMAAVAGFSGRW